MKHSGSRLLTTHVGSLARPKKLLETMRVKESGAPYDQALFDREVREAVTEVVDRQVKIGIDSVCDGEQSKIGFLNYVKDRLSGFSATDGEKVLPDSWKEEVADFPEYYADYFGKYSATVAPLRVLVCRGPVSYVGHETLQTDIDNLK